MAKNKAVTFCEKPLGVGDFEGLPLGGETILLDDASLEVMYGIQETMRTLEPKGLDDIRMLRIETIGRRKSIVWYEVSIRIYKDMHGLSLSSEQGESYYFANKDNWIHEENPVRHSCKHFLERLWGYLCAVVQQIARDPKSYTRYLEEHVPYQEREGYVVRGKILDVLPGIRIEASFREQMIDLLQKKREAPAGGYKAMALRQYIEAWKVACCAYCQSEKLAEESAVEVFRRSNCGQALADYDLDSPEDFARWDKDCGPYHCYDVVYVQIHLYPERDSETGRWYFELAYDLELYADAGYRIATALEKAGIPFVVGDAEGKVAALSGEDTIYFSPDCRDYQLPYPGEDGVTAEQIKQAIGLITWKRFEEVRCIAASDNRVSITFYPCDDEHYPEDGTWNCCIIRYPFEGRYEYCAMRECPYGWNVLERMGGEFCVLPEWEGEE